jgi:hypothetical protein
MLGMQEQNKESVNDARFIDDEGRSGSNFFPFTLVMSIISSAS